MAIEHEIYCDKCGCSTEGSVCQICGSTENRIELIELTPKKLSDYLDFIQNKKQF